MWLTTEAIDKIDSHTVSELLLQCNAVLTLAVGDGHLAGTSCQKVVKLNYFFQLKFFS